MRTKIVVVLIIAKIHITDNYFLSSFFNLLKQEKEEKPQKYFENVKMDKKCPKIIFAE